MKKIGFLIVVIFLALVINNLTHSIYDLWHKQDLVIQAQQELDQEKLKNQKLKSRLSIAQSQEFVEEQARNKLFLAKPGEQSVIIPQKLLKKEEPKKETEQVSNWQKWLDVFLAKEE